MRALYVEVSPDAGLSTEVGVLEVSPLLRELILTAVAGRADHSSDTPQTRIIAVILDQIAAQPRENSRLSRCRVKRVCSGLSMRCSRHQVIIGILHGGPIQSVPANAHAPRFGVVSKWTERNLDDARPWPQNISAFIAMFKRYVDTTPMQYVKGA